MATVAEFVGRECVIHATIPLNRPSEVPAWGSLQWANHLHQLLPWRAALRQPNAFARWILAPNNMYGLASPAPRSLPSTAQAWVYVDISLKSSAPPVPAPLNV